MKFSLQAVVVALALSVMGCAYCEYYRDPQEQNKIVPYMCADGSIIPTDKLTDEGRVALSALKAEWYMMIRKDCRQGDRVACMELEAHLKKRSQPPTPIMPPVFVIPSR